MKFCEKCGNQLEDHELVCRRCGAEVKPVKSGVPSPFSGAGGGLQLGEGTMKYLKIAIYVASALLVIGVFFPSFSVSFLGFKMSMNFIYYDGKVLDGIVFLILGAVSLVFAFLGKNLPNLICGGLAFLFWIFEISNIKKELGQFSDMLQYEIGFWLVTLAVFALLGASIATFVMNKKNHV